MGKVLKTLTISVFLIILISSHNSRGYEQKTPLQPSQNQPAIQSLDTLPLHFVKNEGQIDEPAAFLLKIPFGNVYLKEKEIIYQFLKEKKVDKSSVHSQGPADQALAPEIHVQNVHVRFIGAHEKGKIKGLDRSPAKINYFFSDNPQEWRSNVPAYHKILYKNLYADIDLVIHGENGRIKQDYTIRPGGHTEAIRLKYEGAEKLSINEKGQLLIETRYHSLLEDVPISYQIIDGRRVEIKAGYKLENNNVIGFNVGEYAKDQDLIIDPELVYSTYLGGTSTDGAKGIAVDGSGNAYVTGFTYSSSFPTVAGSYDTTFTACSEAFIAKINPAGSGSGLLLFFGRNRRLRARLGFGECHYSGLVRKCLCHRSDDLYGFSDDSRRLRQGPQWRLPKQLGRLFCHQAQPNRNRPCLFDLFGRRC